MNRPAGRSYLPHSISSGSRKAHNQCRDSPKRTGGETHRAPDVHWIAKDVEREALDTVVHENAKVVAEERARDAQRPRRRHDERLANHEERGGYDFVVRRWQNGVTWLVI